MYPISYVTGRLHVLGHRPNLQIPVPPPRPASAEQGCELGGEGGISCGCDAGRGRQLSTRAHSLTADHTHWLRARQREDRRPNEAKRSGEQGRPAGDVRGWSEGSSVFPSPPPPNRRVTCGGRVSRFYGAADQVDRDDDHDCCDCDVVDDHHGCVFLASSLRAVVAMW
jgi:hypothetical protein